MPELPEVETVVRGLREILVGRTFQRVKITAPPKSIVVADTFGKRTMDRLLRGRTVQAVNRRGKNIFIELDTDTTLWVHLKMTGRFLYVPKTQPPDKHDLVTFDLTANGHPDDPSLHVRFNDYRRFGRLRLFPNDLLWQQDGLRDLGPEPLDLPADDFVALCKRRARYIKPALLDQSFIAGLGNIYADESLWASRIHPLRLTNSLSKKKLVELHGHIQRLLQMGIDLAGTSVNTYSGVNGTPGTMQYHLQVYGKEDAACPRCDGVIVRQKIGSRSAHFCRRCQRG
ncbi:bifunctional DNA-formamidopyrimidine glycosylase/DNA-(apurinic or apyrimidinic site) lyase [candidate division GN15 bacterium]|nr:bifunctional DNA-formamidopyrimidine glycosylase/DNA-(apurinic or apyrimidinic site) lyase [candidate division GN15 bacterium]